MSASDGKVKATSGDDLGKGGEPTKAKKTKASEEDSNEIQYFYGDVVYRIQKKSGHIEFGLVVENSEFVESDDEDDERGRGEGEDELEDRHMKPGFVRVLWHPRAEESVVRERRVQLADRSLMPGDVVRRYIRGQETQRGYCRSVRVVCNAQVVGTEQVVCGVDSRDLRPVSGRFNLDVAVCMDGWVGMIRHIRYLITVKFRDGSVCKLKDSVTANFDDVHDKRDDDCEFRDYRYHRGQELRGSLQWFKTGADFSNLSIQLSKTLEGSFKSLRKQFQTVTVLDVETESLDVMWQCHGLLADENTHQPNPPSHTVRGADLDKVRSLDFFESCTLQLGDRRYYKFKSDGSDTILSKEAWHAMEKDSCRSTKLLQQMKSPIAAQQMSSPHAGAAVKTADSSVATSGSPGANDDKKEQESDAKHTTAATGKVGGACGGVSASKKPRTISGSSQTGSTAAAAAAAAISFTARRGRRGGGRRLRSSNSMSYTPEKAISCGASSTATTPVIKELQSGTEVVVEVLSTRSEASVVWQDGSVEEGVSSRELYPVLHLDDREFFCGDFVAKSSSGSDPDSSSSASAADMQVYGIVQSVGHFSRTCRVKWFRTYNSCSSTTNADDSLRPTELGESEEPVYDLRDHPDFRFRPGTIVIRVGNFAEASPTVNHAEQPSNVAAASRSMGGQVLDNLPEGQVLVWWPSAAAQRLPRGTGDLAPNEETALCWPQDLYKIGECGSGGGGLWEDEYDEEEEYEDEWDDISGGGDEYAGDSEQEDFTDGSWETESEHSFTTAAAEQPDKKATHNSSSSDKKKAANNSSSSDANHPSGGGAGAPAAAALLAGGGFDKASMGPRLALYIDQLRVDMAKLEEIFVSPDTHQLIVGCSDIYHQLNHVIKQLLEIYSDCKRLDRLMGTDFFDEKNFDDGGLIDKVKAMHQKKNSAGSGSAAAAAASVLHQAAMEAQVNRLFKPANTTSRFCPGLAASLAEHGLAASQIVNAVENIVSDVDQAVRFAHVATKKRTPDGFYEGFDKEDEKIIKEYHQQENRVVDIAIDSVVFGVTKEVVDKESEPLVWRGAILAMTEPKSAAVDVTRKNDDVTGEDGRGGEQVDNANANASTNSKANATAAAATSEANAETDAAIKHNILTVKGLTASERFNLGFNVASSPAAVTILVSVKYRLPAKATAERFDEGKVAAAVTQSTAAPDLQKANLAAAPTGQTTAVSTEQGKSTSIPAKADGVNEKSSDDKVVTIPPPSTLSKESANAVCARFCQMVKIQLMKSHLDAVSRFGSGGSGGDNGSQQCFTADDLQVNAADDNLDLDELMTSILINKEKKKKDADEAAEEDVGGAEKQAPKNEKAYEGCQSPADLNENSKQKQQMKTSVSNQEISAVVHGKSAASSAEHHPHNQLSTTDEETPIAQEVGEFSTCETASKQHKYILTVFEPHDPKTIVKFVRKEVQLLRTSLPQGIHVKSFEDRMDLYSVMIKGPEKTPYEDGLFFFDMQLPQDYPVSPPKCHYHSYVTDHRLNPNLYENGKVCVSLLGTWSGKGTEKWTHNSNMLQLLVSIQGLILVDEPYYNEAGYERQRGTQQGLENSRMYNEMVVLKLVQAITKMLVNPPEMFQEEVRQHYKLRGAKMVERLEKWINMSEEETTKVATPNEATESTSNNCTASATSESKDSKGGSQDVLQPPPPYPLLPASKGFRISLQKSLDLFKQTLIKQKLFEC